MIYEKIRDNLKTAIRNNAPIKGFIRVLVSELDREAKNVEQSKELLLKLEKSKTLPSIGAALNVGYNGFGNQFNFLSTDQKWFNYSNLGVSMSIPIFSSLRRSSRTQQAQIALFFLSSTHHLPAC